MPLFSNYWTALKASEKQAIADTVQSQAPASMPAQCTLQDAFEVSERAVCTSALFTTIVLDGAELDGGYSVFVIALTDLISKHFDTTEEVESYLDANTPYPAHSAVWIPLPHYNARKHETDFLKKITGGRA